MTEQLAGSWNPNGLFPIYIISGVAYGMVSVQDSLQQSKIVQDVVYVG
jgi:hypothetical protein